MGQDRGSAIRRLVRSEFACSPKSYWRAATQRLGVAGFLIGNSEYYLDAIHLGGYAAECALKSLILKRTPRSKWADTCSEIASGAKAHNMDFLSEILNRKQAPIPPPIQASLNVIKLEWTTELRYAGALIPLKEARDFLDHVGSIYGWVEARSES